MDENLLLEYLKDLNASVEIETVGSVVWNGNVVTFTLVMEVGRRRFVLNNTFTANNSLYYPMTFLLHAYILNAIERGTLFITGSI